MKRKYRVSRRITLEHVIEAESRKEAEALADEMGELYADFYHASEWKAKVIKPVPNQVM